MTRLTILAVVCAISAASCSGNNNTPTTSTTTAPPNRLVFTASLSAANEVAPQNPLATAEKDGKGEATLTMNVTRDSSGAITAATIDVSSTYTGFPAGTIITLAHIHTGSSLVGGSVLVAMVPSAGEVTMPNGSGSYVRTGFAINPVDSANLIIANPSGYYFNVHTALNPGGAARGQLARTQ
jgi:hypothetical protein